MRDVEPGKVQHKLSVWCSMLNAAEADAWPAAVPAKFSNSTVLSPCGTLLFFFFLPFFLF